MSMNICLWMFFEYKYMFIHIKILSFRKTATRLNNLFCLVIFGPTQSQQNEENSPGVIIFTRTLFHLNWNYPMDTSSSIRHLFEIEIPRGKFVEISSILKGESVWKLWHRFNVKISTWIRLSKSTKYRWVFPRDLTSVLAVSILLFPNILCSGNLF